MLDEKTLSRDGVLRHLLAQARRIETLDELLKKCLEPPLHHHCQVANLTSTTLVLHVHSPTWATRLRYIVPDVLACLMKSCALPARCQVQLRVRPLVVGVVEPSVKRPLRLSSRSAAVIRDVALSIENPELKRALLRVSRHGCE
ncbi:MAG: DciA family protein [Gammaproteobacteria bacterium]